MDLKLKTNKKIFFDDTIDKPEDFGLDQDSLDEIIRQGGIPFKFQEEIKILTLKNTEIEAVSLNDENELEVYTKSGNEFIVVNDEGTYEKIRKAIEFDSENELY